MFLRSLSCPLHSSHLSSLLYSRTSVGSEAAPPPPCYRSSHSKVPERVSEQRLGGTGSRETLGGILGLCRCVWCGVVRWCNRALDFNVLDLISSPLPLTLTPSLPLDMLYSIAQLKSSISRLSIFADGSQSEG
jgi:hypothetical protein